MMQNFAEAKWYKMDNYFHETQVLKHYLIMQANISNMKKSPKVEIVLVDYGSFVTVSANQIYPIQEQFCSEPAVGLFCSFNQLEPPSEAWDIDSIGFFLQHCQSSQLFATFHSIQKGDSKGETFISQDGADFRVSLESREPGHVVMDIGLAMTRRGLARSSVYNIENTSPTASIPIESIAVSSSHRSSSFSEGSTNNNVPKLLCRSSASTSIKMNDSQAIGGAATPNSEFISFESSVHMEALVMNKSSASSKSNSKISELQLNLKESETSKKTVSSAAHQELKTDATILNPLLSSLNSKSEQSFNSPGMEPVKDKQESSHQSNSNYGAAHTSKHSNKTKESSTNGLVNQKRFRAIPPKDIEADLLNDPGLREQVAVYLAHQSETDKSMNKPHSAMDNSGSK
jgi:hypothetical protein